MAEDTVTVVHVSVLEYDGERDFGSHDFAALPRVGETIELWVSGQETVAKVEEVRHVEFHPESGGDTILYVTVKK